MDNRPIGFFDSGLGGLTSVMELHEALPNEKVLYFGDTARTPYGSKSPETIREFAGQIVDYLVSKDVKLIIIACNTVTAMALDDLRARYPDVPIYGVIGPVVRKVVSDGCRNVGIIATKATISSDIYAKKIKELDPSIETYSLACPAIVPLVEEGFTDTEIMEKTVEYYMDSFVKENDFDNLILGCTHYPLVADHIRKLYPDLTLYNSSAEVVNELKEYLTENDMLAGPNEFQDRYYASDLSDNFIAMTDIMFKDRDSKIKLVKFEN
ncbi:MAG: glutamate racemase [Clostridiales bacterium]|nr:glutamate racemase [Candidatus Crickella merdequi]